MPQTSACPFCDRSFTLFRFRHSCSECKRVVCDGCVPKVNGVRRCKICAAPATPSPSQPQVESGNPVLEAALRRQQQRMLGAGADNPNSREKMDLLTEITSLLRQYGEDEPFGLRSMSEIKLRLFLRHLKEKYGVDRK